MTQSERLLRYLNTGRTITAATARREFGMRRLSARINELRSQGYCIYTNRTANGVNYRLGQPSRKIVAFAYQFAGTRLFN